MRRVARGNGTDEEDTGRTAWAAITLAEDRLVVVHDVEPPETRWKALAAVRPPSPYRPGRVMSAYFSANLPVRSVWHWEKM